MGSMSIWHWVIVAAVFVVFFGAKRMPEAARGLGRSLRIFKSEVSEMHNDGKSAGTTAAAPAPELPSGRETNTAATETRSESKTL
ncbi:Sec-independent protein translocase subunit TatA [Nocardia carnea]|uniref:Sec-independent protein translocase subunit TatA n=1 Tax=Nocardia carnea TaxID=37328 RepID=UPI00245392C1|nr:Sec-independent protein translocase subunit TatA [Nocardia carnea]